MKTHTITLDLTNEEIIYIALEAHKQDITFNKYVNDILEKYIQEVEKNSKLKEIPDVSRKIRNNSRNIRSNRTSSNRKIKK